MTDRLNTSKGCAEAASGLTQIQFPNSNFIGTRGSHSTFREFFFFLDLMFLKKKRRRKGSSDDEIYIVIDLQLCVDGEAE